MKMASGFVEDSCIILPTLKDGGVEKLGDLWDCRNAKPLGINIFRDTRAEDLVAYPRKTLDYHMEHIKTTKDTQFTIGVGVELSLKILFVEISQKGEYENIRKTTVRDDEVQFTYTMETYSVKNKSVVNSDFLNEYVRHQLAQGPAGNLYELRASHAATETIYGGNISGSIVIDNTLVETIKKEKSDVFAELVLMPLKIAVDALAMALGALFGDKTTNAVTFSVDAGELDVTMQPKSLQEMFELLYKLDEYVGNKKPISSLPQVTGVPLRHVLVPITSFIDENYLTTGDMVVDRLYREITFDLKNSFTDMMMTLNDYRYLDHIKRQVMEKDTQLQAIVFDSDNLITLKIHAREKELQTIAEDLNDRSHDTFMLYKFGRKLPEDIMGLIEEFEATFNSTKMLKEVQAFKEDVKSELRGLNIEEISYGSSHSTGSTVRKQFDCSCQNHTEVVEDENGEEEEEENEDPPTKITIRVFTNPQQLENWFEGNSRNKILVYTSRSEETPSASTLAALYNLSSDLETNLMTEFGVAVPSISNNISYFQIKTIGGDIRDYSFQKMQFVLEVLQAAVGDKSSPWQNTFYTENASLDGISFPLEELSEFHQLIRSLDNLRSIKLCSNFLQLQSALNDDDKKLKFVATIEATDSVSDAMHHLRRFRSLLAAKAPKCYANSDFIVGKFGVLGYSQAPLLFIFQHKTLVCICLDNLDMLIIIDKLKTVEIEEIVSVDFSNILAPPLDKSNTEWLYGERRAFAVEVAEQYGYILKEEHVSSPPFELIEELSVVHFMRFIQAWITGNKQTILAAVAIAALEKFPILLYTLRRHGWDETRNIFTIGLKMEEELQPMLKDLTSFSSTVLSTFQSKVTYSNSTLLKFIEKEDYGEDAKEEVIKLVHSIATDKGCPESLTEKIQAYGFEGGPDKIPLPLAFRGVQRLLEEVLSQPADDDDDRFYLKSLTSLVDQVSRYPKNKEFTGLDDLGEEYLNKLELSDETYEGCQQQLNNHLKNGYLHQALSLLSKCKYQPKVFLLLNDLNRILDLNDTYWMTEMVREMSRVEYTREHYAELWKTPNFLYFMNHGLNSETFIQAIYIHQCIDGKIPSFLPKAFAKRIREVSIDHNNFTVNSKWENVDEMIMALSTVSVKNNVPRDFMLILTRSVNDNDQLRDYLDECGALFFWNSKDFHFDEPWDVVTVRSVIDILKTNIASKRQVYETVVDGGEPEIISPDTESSKSLNEKDTIPVRRRELQETCGTFLHKVNASEYEQLGSILTDPKKPHLILQPDFKTAQKAIINFGKSKEDYFSYLVQYVLQRFKMESITELLENYPLLNSDNYSKVIRRIDLVTGLMSAAEFVVAHDVLSRISKYQTALPMLTQSVLADNSFLFLHKLLQNIPISWQPYHPISNQRIQSELFAGNFRLIACIRFGANRIGKSSILNLLMKSEKHFTAFDEKLEKSPSLSGCVEFTWLTPDNCSSPFWTNVKNYYNRDNMQPTLVANLHGEAIDFPEVLKLLYYMSSSLLIFLMPAEWEEMRAMWKRLKTIVGHRPNNSVKIMVDPIESCLAHASDESIIYTDKLSENETLDKLHLLLEETVMIRSKKSIELDDYEYGNTIIPLKNPSISNTMMITEKNNAKENTLNRTQMGTIFKLVDSNFQMNTQLLDIAFANILKAHPNLRVFSVSTLGMKSSGKSTLLNALFGSSFAVDVTKVGSGTDGIQMHLVFLKEELRNAIKIDAIIVIDTEGLVINPLSTADNTKARQLTSFALSISNLMLVNIQGSSEIKRLVNALKIGLLNLMKLKNETENCPDILIVEHPGKGDKSMMSSALLMEAVNETIELCEDSDRAIDMGLLLRTAQRILNTILRVKGSKVIQSFPSFHNSTFTESTAPSHKYHESIINLFQTIVNICQTSHHCLYLSEWYQLTKRNWEVISKQDLFPVHFENLRDIRDYMNLQDFLGEVKTAVDTAFRHHHWNVFNDKSATELEWNNLNKFADDTSGRLKLVPDVCEAPTERSNDNESKTCEGVLAKCFAAIKLKNTMLKRLNTSKYHFEFEQFLNDYTKNIETHVVFQILQKETAACMEKGIISDITGLIKEILKGEVAFDNSSDLEPEELWFKLRQIVSTRTYVVPTRRLFRQEIENEYKYAPHVLESLLTDEIPDLAEVKAYELRDEDNSFLKWNDLEWFKQQLERDLSKDIFLLRSGVGDITVDLYEFGMARQLRIKVNEILNEFQNRTIKQIVTLQFQWKVHEIAIKIFGAFLNDKEQQWDEKHQPLGILLRNKDKFMRAFQELV